MQGTDHDAKPSVAEISQGAVLEFCAASANTVETDAAPLLVQGSCRLIGKAQVGAVAEKGMVTQTVLVDTSRLDDVVEFNNLTFCGKNIAGCQNALVTCKRGCVNFTECEFSNTPKALLIDSPECSVCLESCEFADISGVALVITAGNVDLVNCTFSKVHLAIVSHANCVVNTCTFRECGGGILVATCSGDVRAEECELVKCSDFAVASRTGSTLHFGASTLKDNPGAGIVVEGGKKGKKTSAMISECNVGISTVGVRIGSGLVDVQLDSLRVHDCDVGVYVTVDVIGSLIMSKVSYTANEKDLLNAGGSKLHTKIDGILQPQDTQRDSLSYIKRMMPTIASGFLQHGYPLTKFGKRQLSNAGCMDIACGWCKEKEPENVKFKICSKCRGVSYCSQECQNSHWYASHRAECKRIVFRQKCMETTGFVGCCYCHKPELSPGVRSFLACGRCLQVVYCSKDCQLSDWNTHKSFCNKNKVRSSVSVQSGRISADQEQDQGEDEESQDQDQEYEQNQGEEEEEDQSDEEEEISAGATASALPPSRTAEYRQLAHTLELDHGTHVVAMHFFFATDALKRSDAAERADVRQRVAQMHGCVACLVDIKKYFPELVLDAAKVTRMPFSKKVLTFMRENLQPHHVPDVYIPCPYDRDRNCDFYQFDYTKGVKVDVEEAIAFAHIFWDDR